jgi:hypothetical protein
MCLCLELEQLRRDFHPIQGLGSPLEPFHLAVPFSVDPGRAFANTESQTLSTTAHFPHLCPCCGLSRGVFLPLCFLSCLLRRFYSLLVNSCREVTSVRGKQRLSLGLCRGRAHKTPASGNINEWLGPRREDVRKVRNVHWCYWLRIDPCFVPDRGMFQMGFFVRNFVSLMTGCSTVVQVCTTSVSSVPWFQPRCYNICLIRSRRAQPAGRAAMSVRKCRATVETSQGCSGMWNL